MRRLKRSYYEYDSMNILHQMKNRAQNSIKNKFEMRTVVGWIYIFNV